MGTSRLSPIALVIAIPLCACAFPSVDVTDRKYDSDVINRCPQPSEDVPIPNAHYYTHPKDCRKFVSCSYGLPYVLPCPGGTVFSGDLMACVWQHSARGVDCNENGLAKGRPAVCSEGEGLVPHPSVCQRYFNCTDTSSRDHSFLEPYEGECRYPDLFDPVTLRCAPYAEVTCRPGQAVGMAPCDYVRNQCVAAHCEPCYSRAPSCVGRSDGLHEHPHKLWTPHHVVCKDGRSMEVKFCGLDRDSKFRMIFSPERKACVTVWEVPREHRGFMPECLEEEDQRYYVTPESDKVYYKCPGAKVYFCEEGERFDTFRQACIREISNSTSGQPIIPSVTNEIVEVTESTKTTQNIKPTPESFFKSTENVASTKDATDSEKFTSHVTISPEITSENLNIGNTNDLKSPTGASTTEEVSEKVTESVTEKATEAHTNELTEMATQMVTEKVTEKISEKPAGGVPSVYPLPNGL